jgi:hypothetical protein
MKVLKEGYSYSLKNFESGTEAQRIDFINKKPVSEGDKILETIQDGTTNEELLKVLIDRMKFLQGKFPCKPNAIVITNLEESLMWLEERTRDRTSRNAEGKAIS